MSEPPFKNIGGEPFKKIILKDIWRRVVRSVLMNISPSNIFPNVFLA